MEQTDPNEGLQKPPWTHHNVQACKERCQMCTTFHRGMPNIVRTVVIIEHPVMVVIQANRNHPLEDDADVRWKVGHRQNEIKLDDLILVSMHHVSMGSWQPHLRLVHPSAP